MSNPETIEKIQKHLPFLPGLKYDFEKTKLSNHRKSHAFDVTNKVNVCNIAPGIGGKPLAGQESNKVKNSLEIYLDSVNVDSAGAAAGIDASGECVPSWVAFDRKVLRFYAYFQEAVHERREEHFRIRKANIYFYLEDDTIHVSEPKIENSGIPQGTLIRRHRIPKHDIGTGSNQKPQHFLVTDLNVGHEVTFYGRTYKIIGCDNFTRSFYESLGTSVPVNNDFPEDPYTNSRQELLARMKAKRPYQPQTALKQFLENDRKVLRFFGVWDDSTSKYGEVHHMAIQFYLSDDTIEVRELLKPPHQHKAEESNNEEDGPTIVHTASFLKRGKIPKKLMVCRQGMGGSPANQEYYTERDFILGTVVHFYSRPFLICDCDGFTQAYYSEKYGIDHFDPVAYPEHTHAVSSHVKEHQPAIEPRMVTNIGQSIQAPKTSFKNAMKYDNVILRFAAKMRSKDAYDSKRKFVISFYMADYGISVFEQNKSASEGLGGKYLEKGRVRKYPTLDFYEPRDFFVGAQINLYGRIFDIIGSDDFAEAFINQNPDLFAPKQ